MPEVRSWHGATYDRLSTPMEAMGREVLDRLPLEGGETVIDAGCGSGRVTEALIERVPRGRVIGVDASASMIDAARERLGDRAEQRLRPPADRDAPRTHARQARPGLLTLLRRPLGPDQGVLRAPLWP